MFNHKLITIALLVLASAGNAIAIDPNKLYSEANQHFIDGKYGEAIENYEAIIGQGLHSAELYYNLGNAYFKLSNYPEAILNFERAHLLNPDDEDIQFNLNLARTYTVDAIEPLPQFFLLKWCDAFVMMFSTNTWAYIAIGTFLVALLLFAVFWFTGKYQIKRLSFILCIALIATSAVALISSVKLKNRIANSAYAIVFDSAVAAKSSPDNSGKDLFVLHAGTKVQLLRPVGDWFEIKIADGNKGWINKTVFKKI